MDVRPTPTSPRFAHRYPTPSPPNVPQLLLTALVAAGITVTLGAVLLRLLEEPTVTVAPGVSQPSRPFERLREQRSSSVVSLLDRSGVVGAAVAVSSDGWTVGFGSDETAVRLRDGSDFQSLATVGDRATGVAFRKIDASLDPVPLGGIEDRYVGEPVGLLVPGAVPNAFVVLEGSVAEVTAVGTGRDPQSSDVSPTVLRIQTTSSIPVGTPIFALEGKLIGIVRGSGPSGTVNAVPAWSIRGALASILADGTVPRSQLGLTGHPAELEAPGATGFRIDANGVADGSPAARARLTPGSVVLTVNDAQVGVDGQLGDLLLAHRVGETVTLRIQTEGVERTVDVVLGTAP